MYRKLCFPLLILFILAACAPFESEPPTPMVGDPNATAVSTGNEPPPLNPYAPGKGDESLGRIESPKGELAYYVVSNGKPNPWRYHVRPASFVNITCLEQMCIGTKIADFVALLGMLDIVMGELDR